MTILGGEKTCSLVGNSYKRPYFEQKVDITDKSGKVVWADP